jgi:hypothetical protein
MEATIPRAVSNQARHARLIAAGLGTTTATALTIGLFLWARSGFATPPYVFMRGPLPMLAFVFAVATQLASGLVLTLNRPESPVGRLGLVFAAVVSMAVLGNGYLALYEQIPGGPIDPRWVAWLPSWLAFGLATLTAIALGYVFPDGRLANPRWRAPLVLAAAGAVVLCLSLALVPGPTVLYPAYDNPVALGGGWSGLLLAGEVLGVLILVFSAVLVVPALLGRYRAADSIGRLQLRWYIASAILLTVGFVLFVLALISLEPDSQLGEWILIVFIVAGGIPPIALFFAITRYRLYDIDVILSRAFVYGALTAILAGLYTASIRLFNSFFTSITGESSDIALVLTTLVLATSFTPLKRRLEAVVERRFRTAEGASAVSADVLAEPATTAARVASVLLDDPVFLTAIAMRARAISMRDVVEVERGTMVDRSSEPDPDLR